MKWLTGLDQKRKEILALLIWSFTWNYIVYFGARLIAKTWYHADITSNVDMMIPFVPWTVIIYIGWYVFWGVNYGLCAAQEDAVRTRLFCADTIAKAICMVIFLLFPTTNIRPEVADTGILDKLMQLVYYLDNPDNLFPSIHCMVSWLCWIGVRGRKNIPLWYRGFSLLVAVTICISTLTTKQHVLIDVVGGIAIAEGCYLIAAIPKVQACFSKIIESFFRMLRIKGKTEN